MVRNSLLFEICFTVLTFDSILGIGTRSSAGTVKSGRIVNVSDDDDEATGLGTELVTSRFTFVPIHRVYFYCSGGFRTRTVVIVEINLPSGVMEGMFNVEVAQGGNVLQLTVSWPTYMLDPKKFNASWLSESALLLQSSRLTASQKSIQDIQRSFGNANVKSTARIILPHRVDEDISNLSVGKLGFLDSSQSQVKANGLALQVKLLAVEEFSMKIHAQSEQSGFTIVQPLQSRNSSGSRAISTPSKL